MGQFFDEIPDFLIEWIREQHMFWVSTAPLSADGHVNVSPKGLKGTFHVVDSGKVWYEDISGSGIETIAHLKENGRITIMFNAFVGPPRIARLFGRGKVHEFGTKEYDRLLPPGKRQVGSRAVIEVEVYKVGTSCGYGVPFYSFQSHRTRLLDFFSRQETEEQQVESEDSSAALLPSKGIRQYWINKNAKSLDGLPGIETAQTCMAKFRAAEIDFQAGQNGTATGSLSQLGDLVDIKLVIGFCLGVVASAAVRVGSNW